MLASATLLMVGYLIIDSNQLYSDMHDFEGHGGVCVRERERVCVCVWCLCLCLCLCVCVCFTGGIVDGLDALDLPTHTNTHPPTHTHTHTLTYHTHTHTHTQGG